MEAYSDANFGDKEDAIASYGYAFTLNGAAVHSASKKQDKIAKSTSEAEFVAASFTTREALWMNKLLADCSLPRPVTVYMDNTTAMIQIKDLPLRNKYLAVHYCSVFESQRNQDVVFEKISTDDMTADIFTKPLALNKFQKFRNALGVFDLGSYFDADSKSN